MGDDERQPTYVISTGIAVVVVLFLYPATVAPTGEFSNGGAMGTGLLVLASFFAWRAFILNRTAPWIRRLYQLPVTGFATGLAVVDLIMQYASGDMFWF